MSRTFKAPGAIERAQPQRYLIALGSNQRHHRSGAPARVLRDALSELEKRGIAVEAISQIAASAPLGPSRRRYANAAAVVESALAPAGLLAALKAVERDFGRKPRAARWSARVLDLDIILWSGGAWSSRLLEIPHAAFRMRDFVLIPARTVAPGWRDPVTGLTIRHLAARLTRPRPLPR